MSIDTGVIRSEPHSEIGCLLERNAGLLVERWCHVARTEQPTAKRVHHDVLRDQLLTLLQATGRSLRQAGNREPHQLGESAFEHGEQRWDCGWSLAELIRDYQILQLVILEYLEETLDRPLRHREVMAVGVFINDAVAASIATYVSSRDAETRRIEHERTVALEEANRRKDEFIAMLAHELRNPLAPIQNSAQMLRLRLTTADPVVLQAVDVVQRQTKQLIRLVDDLLDLARIAQGRFELRKTQVNLGTVLDQAIQMTNPDFKVREHRFTATLPAAPLYVEADPERLIQIVINLLHNAAKYTERSGQIWLSAERDGDHAVIRVRDTGIGIPPEMLARIFDLFTQLEGAHRLSQGGLGIGLTLVRRLVELHEGSITAESAGLGHGSEFVVRLPALVKTLTVAPAQRNAEPVIRAPCHLLIVEDNADARDSLATLLGFSGHHVEIAETGLRGIEKAIASKPQAALIDIGLPDVNGYEVAKRVRAELGNHIFLIALTGYGQSDDLRRALDAGFDAHIIKPADFAELGRLLARASTIKL
jgi:signal transduction histidine kinase/ActR/RegA family two-component response regulator